MLVKSYTTACVVLKPLRKLNWQCDGILCLYIKLSILSYVSHSEILKNIGKDDISLMIIMIVLIITAIIMIINFTTIIKLNTWLVSSFRIICLFVGNIHNMNEVFLEGVIVVVALKKSAVNIVDVFTDWYYGTCKLQCLSFENLRSR